MPGLAGRRRRAAEEDEESAPGSEVSEDDTQDHMDVDVDASRDNNATALNEMVKQLIRLALACELQRRPLRRAEVGEKVLRNAGRQFRKVFAQAQDELRRVFGMELIELPARDKVTLAQKRAAQQKADTNKSTTVTAWILVSVIPSEYHDPTILPPSAVPDATQDSTYTAIYTLIVSLIALNREGMPEAKLERYLARMQMEDTTPVKGYEKTDKLLKRLEKDGYIVKIRESIGVNGEEEVSWVVGPRGKVEVGDAGVKGLVETVYGHPDGDDGADLVRRIERSLGVGEQRPTNSAKRQKKGQDHPVSRPSKKHVNDDDGEDDD